MAVLSVIATLLPTQAVADAQRAAAAPSDVRDWTGRMAPNFSLRTLDGRNVRLSDFRGKVVLLNFWATWCAPCRVEMPWLVEFHQQYRSHGLEVVGVAVDDGNRDEITKFVHDRHVGYTILLNDQAVGDAYGGLRLLPQTVFIGRDGRILRRSTGVLGKTDFEVDIRRALNLPLE